jgi:hypothetical protein
MEEPSVLDFLKKKIDPRNWGKRLEDLYPQLSETDIVEEIEAEPEETPAEEFTTVEQEKEKASFQFPWKTLAALFLALVAQRMLEPTSRNVLAAVMLYAASLGLIVLAVLKKEWSAPDIPAREIKVMGTEVRPWPFFLFIPVALLAFIELRDNRFTALNLFLWLVAIGLGIAAFWKNEKKFDPKSLFTKIGDFLRNPKINIHISAFSLLVIVVFLVGAYFHFTKLTTVPFDMTSDHAEKILDINDILHGTYPLFFARNGGREPIEFYLCAALVKWFGTSLDFITLKLAMGLAFMVGLIFVYKLGKEMGNRWTGLLAMLFLGFASWTNIITRIGLRLVLYPVFTAIVLYFLLRGFRRSNRNDFVLAGIFLGLGLLGYSAFRVVPLVVVLAILIFVLHQKDKEKRKEAWWALGIMIIFAFVLAMPLIHFAIQYPDAFGYRTLSRMTSTENQITGSIVGVFFSNVWNALRMPFYDDGSTWVIAVTNRPALDVITAAMYFVGLAMVVVRWIKTRHWQDMFMVLSIPVLMLPSIMALAFPNENPSLSRAGGAIIPIIIIAMIGFQSLLTSLWSKCRSYFGKGLVVIVALGLVLLSARQNYDLYFNQYNTQYANSTWNTGQIGEVCKGYIDSVGTPDTCYVVGLAYWVDTRLVSMVAGYPTLDNAIWPKDIQTTLDDPRGKMFIVQADQADAIALLKSLYPDGFSTLHASNIPGRSFVAYQVPPQVEAK